MKLTDRSGHRASAEAGSEPRPPPPTPRTPRLDTGDKVRLELAKIYRQARHGHLAWESATKAAHILYLLHRMLDAGTLDGLTERVAILEAGRTSAP